MEFKWTPECDEAFEELKFRLGTAPVLALYDPTLETEVRCDHSALTFLQSKKQLSPKLTRFAMQLQEFDCRIVYKAGHLNKDADALSRLPVDADESNVHADEIEGEVEYLKENREFVFMAQPEETIPEWTPNDTRPSRDNLLHTDSTFREATVERNWQRSDITIDCIRNDLRRFASLPRKRRKELMPFFINGNGLVCREDETIGLYRVLVPKQHQDELIEQYHAAAISAHPGIGRTYEKLAAKYF